MDGVKFNLQKGLFRLWIVLSIAWFAFWSYSVFSVNETGISIKGSVHLHDIVLAMTLPFWLFLLPLWVIVKLSKFVQSKNLIRKLRSMATNQKRILFLGIVGSTWFLGQEVWFRKATYYGSDPFEFFLKFKEWDAAWHWVFITTFIVAFLSFWLLFGLKDNKIDSDK